MLIDGDSQSWRMPEKGTWIVGGGDAAHLHLVEIMLDAAYVVFWKVGQIIVFRLRSDVWTVGSLQFWPLCSRFALISLSLKRLLSLITGFETVLALLCASRQPLHLSLGFNWEKVRIRIVKSLLFIHDLINLLSVFLRVIIYTSNFWFSFESYIPQSISITKIHFHFIFRFSDCWFSIIS